MLAEQLARAWADKMGSVVVNEGGEDKFSARHWATEAERIVSKVWKFAGEWDPTSGGFPIPDDTHEVYLVVGTGTIADVDYYPGDFIFYTGTAWKLIDNTPDPRRINQDTADLQVNLRKVRNMAIIGL